MRCKGCGFLLIWIWLPGGVLMNACPSQVSRGTAVLLGVMTKVMWWLPSITIGLRLKVCGNIGTITIASSCGCKIGPPPDKAYAVEPVGVAIMTPSESWLHTN